LQHGNDAFEWKIEEVCESRINDIAKHWAGIRENGGPLRDLNSAQNQTLNLNSGPGGALPEGWKRSSSLAELRRLDAAEAAKKRQYDESQRTADPKANATVVVVEANEDSLKAISPRQAELIAKYTAEYGEGIRVQGESLARKSAEQTRIWQDVKAETGLATAPDAKFAAEAIAPQEEAPDQMQELPLDDGGTTVLTIGERNKGRTYRDILATDPGYCKYVLNEKQPTGEFKMFQLWLQQHQQEGRALQTPPKNDSDLASTKVGFGKHKDVTYQEVWDTDADYCDYARSLSSRHDSPLRKFQDWLDRP